MGSKNYSLYILAAQNNPFLQDDQQQYTYDAAGMQQQGGQQAYYGGGYTQAQSGYSSSGYGKLFKFSYSLHIMYNLVNVMTLKIL